MTDTPSKSWIELIILVIDKFLHFTEHIGFVAGLTCILSGPAVILIKGKFLFPPDNSTFKSLYNSCIADSWCLVGLITFIVGIAALVSRLRLVIFSELNTIKLAYEKDLISDEQRKTYTTKILSRRYGLTINKDKTGPESK